MEESSGAAIAIVSMLGADGRPATADFVLKFINSFNLGLVIPT